MTDAPDVLLSNPETGLAYPESIPADNVVVIHRRADGTPYIIVREA